MLIILREVFVKEETSIRFSGRSPDPFDSILLVNHLEKDYFVERKTSTNNHSSVSFY